MTVPVYPANSAFDLPVQTTLRWGKTAGATSYRVQMALSSAFAPTVVDTANLSDTTFTPALLDYYKIYFWRVKASNSIGAAEWNPYYRFRTVHVTAVERQDLVPEAYALSQNYPNPFNPTTTIQIAVPSAGRVVLKVFDVLGKEETTLVDAEMQAGEFVATKRMLLLR